MIRTSTAARIIALASTAALALTLSACNGSGTGLVNSLTNTATVRFVNGSPDAGPVDVFIDNQHQYCPSSGSCPGIAYGGVTGVNTVKVSAGSHAIVIYPAGNDTGAGLLPSNTTFSVNSGGNYTIVLTGEMHPVAGAAGLALTTISQTTPYSTSSGGAAVNFNNASPYFTSTNGGSVQFGYYLNSTPANNAAGTAIGLGQSTLFGVPSSALNVPITFYAGSSGSGVTTTPSSWSTSCGTNSLPCDTGNLSLFLIDGPAASTAPTTPPSGVSATATAIFVGAFDPNGY